MANNIRKLKVEDNGIKEFNHLRISNLNYFFSVYGNNKNCYLSPFKILANLEKKVLFKNNPPEFIMVPYKSGGAGIFRRTRIKEKDNIRIVYYEYDCSAS